MTGSHLGKLILKVVAWLRREQWGFTLVGNGGHRHNRIRGDLIPHDTMVIAQGGRSFVRTGELDDQGFAVFREGHKSHTYPAGR